MYRMYIIFSLIYLHGLLLSHFFLLVLSSIFQTSDCPQIPSNSYYLLTFKSKYQKADYKFKFVDGAY